MIPKCGYRFPACAKLRRPLCFRLEASAGEGRSERIMRKNKTQANSISPQSHSLQEKQAQKHDRATRRPIEVATTMSHG
jgi:hypothetical protein